MQVLICVLYLYHVLRFIYKLYRHISPYRDHDDYVIGKVVLLLLTFLLLIATLAGVREVPVASALAVDCGAVVDVMVAIGVA
jgi:hypothetical protein